MRDYKSLTHTRWDCKYHIVFILKCRKQVIYGSLRKNLGSIFHELAKRRGLERVTADRVLTNLILFIC